MNRIKKVKIKYWAGLVLFHTNMLSCIVILLIVRHYAEKGE